MEDSEGEECVLSEQGGGGQDMRMSPGSVKEADSSEYSQHPDSSLSVDHKAIHKVTQIMVFEKRLPLLLMV